MRKYLECYAIQIKNNFIREAVYRTNFLTAITVDIIWMAIELSLFKVLYTNIDTLGGWTQNQTFFFLGIFFSSDALFTIFFQRNFWNFSDLVNHGELDVYLTKPIHPLFLAFSRSINLTAVFNFILGCAVAIRFSGPAGFEGGWHWIEFPFWLALGLYTAFQIRFFFSIWVFWTDRSWAISRLYYHFFTLATKPDTIYPKMIRYLVLTAIPFAFIGSVPARALLHGLELHDGLHIALVLVGFTLINRALWNKGLQRYQSASS